MSIKGSAVWKEKIKKALLGRNVHKEAEQLQGIEKSKYWTRIGWKSFKRMIFENYPKEYHRALQSTRQAEGRRRAWSDPEVRARCVGAIKAKWQDSSSRANRLKILRTIAAPKISKTLKGRMPSHRPSGGSKYLYDGVNGKIWMRAKSEIRYAYKLDGKGITWLYEAFTFVIGPGQRRSWTPDFYLPEYQKFVEVKGWLLPTVKRKIRKVMKHFPCIRFEVRNDKDFRISKEFGGNAMQRNVNITIRRTVYVRRSGSGRCARAG